MTKFAAAPITMKIAPFGGSNVIVDHPAGMQRPSASSSGRSAIDAAQLGRRTAASASGASAAFADARVAVARLRRSERARSNSQMNASLMKCAD